MPKRRRLASTPLASPLLVPAGDGMRAGHGDGRLATVLGPFPAHTGSAASTAAARGGRRRDINPVECRILGGRRSRKPPRIRQSARSEGAPPGCSGRNCPTSKLDWCWRLSGQAPVQPGAPPCQCRRVPKRAEETTVADRLIVRGAREHNLRDVNLDLPRDALIVFTGLSGSGKSSLAFDTIF